MAYFRSTQQVLRRLINQNQSTNNHDRITNSLLFSAQGLRFRKIEVILTTSIDKLGKPGDVVKVAPGYFRNHLMPKMLAMPNINKFRYLVREQLKLYQYEGEEHISKAIKEKYEASLDAGLSKEDKVKEYQAAALRLHNGLLSIRRLVKVDNELRVPVTKEEIVAEVARQLGVSIQPENLHLPSPFTAIGEYAVPLRLPRALPRPEGLLQWTLRVKVRRKRSGIESPLVKHSASKNTAKESKIEPSEAKQSEIESAEAKQSENESAEAKQSETQSSEPEQIENESSEAEKSENGPSEAKQSEN